MSLLTIEEKIDLLRNLLADPEDWVSEQILILNEQAEEREQREASEHASGTVLPRQEG